MRIDIVLRVVSKLFIPFILLFALYVQFHGETGPGGGFQAGVAIGAGVILYAIMFGLEETMRYLPVRLVEILVPTGALIFLGVGVVTMLLGGNYLDYDALLPDDPPHAQELGIIVIELGVLITVASTMIAIFYAFGGRGR